MLWKGKPGKSEAKGSGKGPDLLSRVRNDVTVMRKQGEPPEKDTSSFSRYHCDLCNNTFLSTELKQCTLCGRWACATCWTQEYYICNSCNGILRLHMIQVQEKGRVRE
jgi:hypothetical protein